MTGLRRIARSEVSVQRRPAIDARSLAEAVDIVEDVRVRGEPAVREHSIGLGDLQHGASLIIPRTDLENAYDALKAPHRALLHRVASRIEGFARTQRDALGDVETEVVGGRAGHRWIPVTTVGAYAPGGRHPLPSSVLMTVIPARVAGVDDVWVASPRPAPLTLGAAWVAGADGVLPIGGAQAIAALAFGTVSPACDLIVGPGNRWVTAAKKHLFGEVGIDGLAGPSEILVIADDTADPVRVAADLLGQAEHDTDAMPSLIATSIELADAVDVELERQLEDLPTAHVAAEALENGFALVVTDLSEAVEISDSIAPEHLALHVAEPDALAGELTSYGSLLEGVATAEAFADYGAGPNHVLPTGGGARYQSGLSVMTYLKSPTWLRLDEPSLLAEDTALLARLERLEAHARSAAARRQ